MKLIEIFERNGLLENSRNILAEDAMRLNTNDRETFKTLYQSSYTLRILMGKDEIRAAERLAKAGVVQKGCPDEKGAGRVMYYVDEKIAENANSELLNDLLATI